MPQRESRFTAEAKESQRQREVMRVRRSIVKYKKIYAATTPPKM
jgi:hypothetical protein